MNRYDFLRSFWFHYAGLYPDNPQSHQFRDGYGGSTPVYWVRGTAIGIRQTVGTYTLVTNVIGEDVGMRIVPFLRRLGREFEDMDIHVDGMWCKSEFMIEGEAYDVCRWGEMAEWLEGRRQVYESVLRS